MNDPLFLAHLIDRFSPGAIAFVVMENGQANSRLTLKDLSELDVPIVTHDVTQVVECFRYSDTPLPANLVEIGDALKFRSQLSRDQGGEPQWSVWKAASELFDKHGDAKLLSQLQDAKLDPPSRGQVVSLLSSACSALEKLWQQLVVDLEQVGERVRFCEYEMRIQQIFHYRQYFGIRVNENLLQEHIDSAKRDKFSAFRKLAACMGMNPTGMPLASIVQKLKRTDASHLVEFADLQLLEDYIELASARSKTASLLLEYTKAERDLKVLLKVRTNDDRIHPKFQCHGTITSRILVADPGLQQLRRKFRDILLPESGKTLIYLDFAQFEPGILASMSNDGELIAAYNSADLYTALSVAVFGTEEHRTLAKRVFLSFCFGMSLTGIAKLLAGAEGTAADRDRYAKIIDAYFSKFPAISVFRREKEAELQREGKVGTLLGNFRARRGSSELSPKERRWSLSQAVQGTASLIFKDALLRIQSDFGNEAILLPMHDAVLLQASDSPDEQSHVRETAKRRMEQAFVHWCPQVSPKISYGGFVN